jgi:hypothetical protein
MTAAAPVVACDFALSAYDARERARVPVHGKCVCGLTAYLVLGAPK